ncbi:MAG: hypothetical protein U9Q79_05210 [Candidatus Hydrogenedentes bacterium]|nr:hypothetical protein [Candidatus Hydrogenedentota bacterium]
MLGMSEESQNIHIEPMEFNLAPQWRRSVYYVAGALLLVPIVGAALPHLTGTPGDELRDLAPVILIAVLLCLWVHHWRLRVDNEGIHRRRLVKWTSWPWEDFANGHVLRERGAVTFTFLDSASGKGGFTLAYLSPEARKQVADLINRIWNPPPMPETPSELRLGVRKGFLSPFQSPRQVTLTPSGIETDWTGCMHVYRWEEIAGIALELNTRDQHDFERLRISLPDTEIELRVRDQKGKGDLNWKGAQARDVVAFLMSYVPEEKFQVAALVGPAQSLADFEARSVRIERREQESRKVAWFVVCVFAAFGVWLAAKAPSFSNPLEDPPPALKVLVVVTMLLVAAGPVLLLGIVLTTPRAWRKRRRELEAEREKFLEEHGAELEGAPR